MWLFPEAKRLLNIDAIFSLVPFVCVALPGKKAVTVAQQEQKKNSSIEFSMLVLNIGDFKQHDGEQAYF